MIDSRREARAFSHKVRAHLLRSSVHEGKVEFRVGIVGGGATGVELAAELLQAAQTAVAYGVRGSAERLKIVLIESGPRLLAAFPEKISKAAEDKLRALGVEVRLNTRVTSVTHGTFVLADDSRIEATLKVWAAGIKAPDFLGELDGLETNRSNQLVVDANLQSISDPAIYALGDCATLTLPEQNRPLPPTAQVAHQQARYLSREIPRRLAWQPGRTFRYRDMGMLVTLGRYTGYGSLGKFGIFDKQFFEGKLAQLGHALLYRAHQARIMGFWRGTLSWLVDRLNSKIRAPVRLD